MLRKQISPCKPHPLPPGKALEDDTERSLPGMSRHEFSKQGAPLLRRVLGKSITSEGLCPSCPVTQPVEEVASLHSWHITLGGQESRVVHTVKEEDTQKCDPQGIESLGTPGGLCGRSTVHTHEYGFASRVLYHPLLRVLLHHNRSKPEWRLTVNLTAGLRNQPRPDMSRCHSVISWCRGDTTARPHDLLVAVTHSLQWVLSRAGWADAFNLGWD